jgi:hypothetical protein
MKFLSYLILLFLCFTGCIEKFAPDITEDQDLIVVDGMITDQPGVNIIKISKSSPLGTSQISKPLRGCSVSITDDQNNTFILTESDTYAGSGTFGTYLTDPATFKGVPGRKYTLHIKTNNSTTTHYTYQSLPMEMIPVPQIDSLFYKKTEIPGNDGFPSPGEGAQIYLNTYDRNNYCKFFRWDFSETWKIQLPLYNTVINRTCWITDNSKKINIKNTSILKENRVNNFPLFYISNETDRLSVRYSVLVNQYSVNEEEYGYWEKLQTITEDVGSLYDITPSSVKGNLYCIEKPDEQVLGYFSVSAKASKRLYVDENFKGLVDPYSICTADTTFGGPPPAGLNLFVWLIEDNNLIPPLFKIFTYERSCVDCTVRGTKKQPDYWSEN